MAHSHIEDPEAATQWKSEPLVTGPHNPGPFDPYAGHALDPMTLGYPAISDGTLKAISLPKTALTECVATHLPSYAQSYGYGHYGVPEEPAEEEPVEEEPVEEEPVEEEPVQVEPVEEEHETEEHMGEEHATEEQPMFPEAVSEEYQKEALEDHDEPYLPSDGMYLVF